MDDHGSLTLRPPGPDWIVADEERTRAAGAAFLALRRSESAGFTTNVSVTGQVLAEESSIEALADQLVGDLRKLAPGAETLKREQYGSAGAPGVMQLLAFSLPVEGTEPLELQQLQVVVEAPDRTPGSDAALVYLVSLTGEPDEMEASIGDFQNFLATLAAPDADSDRAVETD